MKQNMKPLLLSTIGVITASAFLVSCSDESADDHAGHDHDAPSQIETVDHADHAGGGTAEVGIDGLTLNDGARWKMDDHTRTAFATMAASFLSADHAAMDSEGLKAVGTDLRQGINDLILGCTMSGDSHSQLHVLLGGYIPAVDALAESGLLEDAVKVKHYLETYDEYFE